MGVTNNLALPLDKNKNLFNFLGIINYGHLIIKNMDLNHCFNDRLIPFFIFNLQLWKLSFWTVRNYYFGRYNFLNYLNILAIYYPLVAQNKPFSIIGPT